MTTPLLVLIGAQLLFTCGDLLARQRMPRSGFTLAAFLSGWFAVYVLLRTFATFGQLYVLSTVQLGRSAALFGAMSIILANLLGFLVLREVLSVKVYVGITLAVVAFLVIASSR